MRTSENGTLKETAPSGKAPTTSVTSEIMEALPIDLGRRYTEGDVRLNLDLPSLAGEVSSLRMGGDNRLGVMPSRAVSEFLRYGNMFDVGNPHIERKVLHSMRVAALSVAIAGEGEYREADIDLGIMFLAGLLHDCARLPQFAMFRSYDDHATSCDHGDLGADLLGTYGFLARFMEGALASDGDRPDGGGKDPIRGKFEFASMAIVESVRWHNKKDLPEGLDPSVIPYARLLRDADIIDIMRLWLTGHMSDAPRPVMRDEVSQEVAESVRRRQTVDRRSIRTAGDRIVSKGALPWALSATARDYMAHVLGMGSAWH